MDESEILKKRIAQNSPEVPSDSPKELGRFAGYDATYGMPVIRNSSGGIGPIRRSDSNASYRQGEAVKQTGAGLGGSIDTAIAWRKKPVASPVAEEKFKDAIPVLFTRLNDAGDREFWLGGDRANPVLLDTFPPLNLFTNDWIDAANGSAVVAGPNLTINLSGSASATAAGLLDQKIYQNTFALNLPTYILGKVTGSAAGQTSGFGYIGAGSVDLYRLVAAPSQVLGGGPGVTAATRTDTDYSLSYEGGGSFTAPNRQYVELFFPGNNGLSYETGIRYLGADGPSISGNYAIQVDYEFIPCYLSATASERFILLQPSPGVLRYYRVAANSNRVLRSTFTAPDPVATNSTDWRSPLASHTPLDYPFTIGNYYQQTYWMNYGPWNYRFVDGSAPFLSGRYAANISGEKLFRLDSLQPDSIGIPNPALLYLNFTSPLEGPGLTNPGVEALVNNQDLQLKITRVTLEPPTGLTDETTKTVTAKSLQTPGAVILAISPVIV